MVIVYEAKFIKDLVPEDFIEYFQKCSELFNHDIVDDVEGNHVVKDRWKPRTGLKTAIYIRTLYAPQLNKETGELVYIDTTIGNAELEQKHITAEEMNNCFVAKRSECWIISPVRGET